MENKKYKKILRFMIYVLGVAVLSFGVVLNIKTEYGVSPVNSLPYCISILSGIELGNVTIVCYTVYVFIQILMKYKRETKWHRVLWQLPFGILFGKFTTFFNELITVNTSGHLLRIILLIAAIFCTALGVVLTVNMRLVPIPPDGLASELAKGLQKDLGTGKMIFDILSVAATFVVSLIWSGSVIGIGFGTLVCAVMIGRTVKLLNIKLPS